MKQKHLNDAHEAHSKIVYLKSQMVLVEQDKFYLGINNTYCGTSILKAVKNTILVELQS